MTELRDLYEADSFEPEETFDHRGYTVVACNREKCVEYDRSKPYKIVDDSAAGNPIVRMFDGEWATRRGYGTFEQVVDGWIANYEEDLTDAPTDESEAELADPVLEEETLTEPVVGNTAEQYSA